MSNQLTANQQLTLGQQITSSNGKAYLTMQSDGNFVLYRKDNGAALWASSTSNPAGSTGNNYAIMQTDGNLVVYTATNVALWAAGTNGNSGAYTVLDDTANLIVYSSTNTALWSSNTVQWQLTPSTVAANAIWSANVTCAPGQVYFDTVMAPGWEYKMRLNGADYADAPYGLAQTSGLPMATTPLSMLQACPSRFAQQL